MSRAIAVTPLNLLLQLLWLPPLLWLIAATDGLLQLAADDLAAALAVVILPLVLANLIEARPERDAVQERLAWWPVQPLAHRGIQIAAAQVGAVLDAPQRFSTVMPVFVGFLAWFTAALD